DRRHDGASWRAERGTREAATSAVQAECYQPAGGQRLRNSGERRRASATWRAAPKVLMRRRTGKPPPWTPKTDAPGWSLIEMVAYIDALFRAMTLRPSLISTW